MIDHQRHLATNRDPRKSEISKSLCSGSPSLYTFPHLPGERHPLARRCFSKNCSPKQNFSNNEHMCGRPWENAGWTRGRVRESKHVSLSHHPQVRLRNRSCLRGLGGLQDCPPSKLLGPLSSQVLMTLPVVPAAASRGS